jgi:carotenoid cleavage dioxygenase
MINQQYTGVPNRYVYSTKSKPGWFLFTGFVKHDLETGKSWELDLSPNRYASEAPFAPRLGARDEDDGYLISFVTDENTHTSECIVIDAKRFADGPVCRIGLPHKICSGTHAHWAPGILIQHIAHSRCARRLRIVRFQHFVAELTELATADKQGFRRRRWRHRHAPHTRHSARRFPDGDPERSPPEHQLTC